jgi:type IV pilus assembly protein PilC
MTVTMHRYRYEAETREGEAVKGTIEAASANSARNTLAVEGIRVTKIAERKGLKTELTKEKVPIVDLMHFSRQMATFLRAGVPVMEALENLRDGMDNARFKAILFDIEERVSAGMSMSAAIALHNDVFPPYYVAMMRAADLTGRLDDAFSQLHRYLKRDVELRKQVRKALIYPAILLVVSIVVVAIITIFVIPKFAEFFKSFGAQLPLPTRMLIAIANFVQSTTGLVVMVLLVIGAFGCAMWQRTPGGRRFRDRAVLRIPLMKTVVQYSSTERFSRAMAVLLEAGVPLTEALPSATACTENTVFQARLGDVAEGVMNGEGFAEPIRQAGVFPTTMVQMVRVGERTGEMSEQLDNVAGFYESELDHAVDKLTQYFEPMVVLIIGAVVGFVALAMVSAMYGIYGQVHIQ